MRTIISVVIIGIGFILTPFIEREPKWLKNMFKSNLGTRTAIICYAAFIASCVFLLCKFFLPLAISAWFS